VGVRKKVGKRRRPASTGGSDSAQRGWKRGTGKSKRNDRKSAPVRDWEVQRPTLDVTGREGSLGKNFKKDGPGYAIQSPIKGERKIGFAPSRSRGTPSGKIASQKDDPLEKNPLSRGGGRYMAPTSGLKGRGTMEANQKDSGSGSLWWDGASHKRSHFSRYSRRSARDKGAV